MWRHADPIPALMFQGRRQEQGIAVVAVWLSSRVLQGQGGDGAAGSAEPLCRGWPW